MAIETVTNDTGTMAALPVGQTVSGTIDSALENGYTVYTGAQLSEIMALAERDDVISATEGRFTTVQDALMRNSLEASWHQDGLSYEHPPSRVLLYCESPGRGDITTDLADVESALKKVDLYTKGVLKELNRYYVSRSGENFYDGPLIREDSITGNEFLSLCSRGWVRGKADTTLEQMTRAMFALFEAFEPVLSHQWNAGDCLVFDNIKHVHRRHNPKNLIDRDRRLIRIWFR